MRSSRNAFQFFCFRVNFKTIIFGILDRLETNLMYSKNKTLLSKIFEDVRDNIITCKDFLQSCQNIIGEEIERKDVVKVYDVDEGGTDDKKGPMLPLW